MVPLGNGLRISLWEWLLGTWYCSNGNKGGRSLIRSFGEAYLGETALNLQHLLAKLSLSQVPVHKVPCAFPLLHEVGNYSAKFAEVFSYAQLREKSTRLLVQDRVLARVSGEKPGHEKKYQ